MADNFLIKWIAPKRPKKTKRPRYMNLDSDIDIHPIMSIIGGGSPDPVFRSLWELHLNFPISHSLQRKIESVPGVEILIIGTPYRMKIGFGKLFDKDEVRIKIQQVLKEHTECLQKLPKQMN